MNFTKLKINTNQRTSDILEAIAQCSTTEIVLNFTSNHSALLEKSFLKQLKSISKDHNKELIIIAKKKLVRDFLKKSKITTYSIVPAKFKEGEQICLFDFLGLKPEKKITVQKSDTKESTPDSTDKKDKTKKSKQKPKKTKSKDSKKENTPSDLPEFAFQRVATEKTPLRARIFFWVLGIIGLFTLLFLWQSPTAVITLRPRISTVPVLQNMILSLPEAKISQTESTLPVIKSILIDATVTDTETVPTSGREYELTNATGKITLFNESDTPKQLVPSRLQTKNGLIFRFKRPVTIPAKKGSTAGRVVVNVVADEFDTQGKTIGIRGNIDAGTELFFPALRENLQEIYYAKAINGPLVGGSTLTKYKIDEADVDRAKKVLEENFKDRALQILEKKIANRQKKHGENHILLTDPDFIFTELSDFKFPTETIGQESQTVTVNGSLTVSALIFDQETVKTELRKFLKKSIDERREIIDIDDTSIEYIPFNIKKFKDNYWGKISVKAFATEQFSVDSNNPNFQQWIYKIKQDITNKTKEEIKPILANKQDIEEVVKIEIKPFWATKTPLSPQNISFKITNIQP